MAFQNRIQENFARGEVSPEVQSRPNLEIAQSSLKLCRNFIPKFEGGISYAPGTTFITAASVIDGSVLVPFVYRDSQAFQFEIFVDSSDDLNIRILKDNGVLLFSKGNVGWIRNDAGGGEGSDSQLIGFQAGAGDDPANISAATSDAGAECTFDFTGGAAEDIVQDVAHGMANGTEIYFTNSGGDLPAELDEYKSYYVINKQDDYYQIATTVGGSVVEFTDDGTVTSKYHQYTYGGEVTVTVAGTFAAADLQNIRYAQSGAAMVIAVEGKFCIQIWRGGTTETAWAINEASVVSSSFVAISAIANNDGFAKYTTAAHTLAVGDVAIIKDTDNDNNMDGAFNITEVADNTHFTTGQEFLATSITGKARKGGTFHDFAFAFDQITDFMTDAADIPKEVKFNDGRLYFVLDDKLYGSRSVVDGQDMYSNYTQAITPLATDAVEFTASISSDKIDLFKWLKVSNKAFYAGMENLIATITGETSADPIAGDSIRMQSSEDRGSSDVPPIEDGKDIIFVGSTGKKVSSFAFNLLQDSEQSNELSLLNKHMFTSTVKRMVFQRGNIDIVWVLLADNNLIGFIFNSSENITGWFHYHDGQGDLFKDISVSPVSNGVDRLWTIVARSDGSTGTIDQIEQLEIPTRFVRIEDFYTGDTEAKRAEDLRRWQNAIYEQQKESANMHSMLTLNTFDTTLASGNYLHFNAALDEVYVSSAGTAATKLTTTNSPLNGETTNNVVIKATSGGLGEGIYSIDDYTSGTGISNVTDELTLADYGFDDTESSYIIPPGFWGISFGSITSASLQRYFDSTGADIDVVLDGGPVSDIVITESGGEYTADLGELSGNVIYFGYKYIGVIATLPINMGGVRGSSFSKLKNIDDARVSVLDSVNLKWGVDPYNLNEIDFRIGTDKTDRPIPPVSNTLTLPNPNGAWDSVVSLYFVQDVPVPLEILSIDISGDAQDE